MKNNYNWNTNFIVFKNFKLDSHLNLKRLNEILICTIKGRIFVYIFKYLVATIVVVRISNPALTYENLNGPVLNTLQSERNKSI